MTAFANSKADELNNNYTDVNQHEFSDESTNTDRLVRRTTAQLAALTLAAADAGKVFYDTTLNKMKFWNGSAFETVTSA